MIHILKIATSFSVFLLFVWPDLATAQTITATQNGKPISTTIDPVASSIVAPLSTTTPSLAATIATSPPPPIIDPIKELRGLAIVSALSKGGYNLYMRHGSATEGQDVQTLLQTPRWWENCALQRNLSEAGIDQARRVGAALRQLNVPINMVRTSQFCRTRDTAYAMGFDSIEVTEDLNHQMGQRAGFDVHTARFAQLAAMPLPDSNVLMISHTHASPRAEERVMGQIQETEIIVYQPDGKGGAAPVARISSADWDALILMVHLAETK